MVVIILGQLQPILGPSSPALLAWLVCVCVLDGGKGHVAVASFLLDHHAAINQPTRFTTCTALYMACDQVKGGGWRERGGR